MMLAHPTQFTDCPHDGRLAPPLLSFRKAMP